MTTTRMLPGGGTVRSKFLASLLIGGSLFIAIAGCTSGGSATPQSNPTTAPTTTSSAPKSEIVDPLNIDKLTGDICAGFTDAQLAPYLGTLAGKDPDTSTNGPLCTFRSNGSTGSTVGGSVANIAAPTTDLLYQSAARFPWRRKISPISGYPASDASTTANPSDPVNGGDCSTAVAVNDKQFINVDFSATSSTDPNFTKPCTVSEALAAILIQNIKTGGS